MPPALASTSRKDARVEHVRFATELRALGRRFFIKCTRCASEIVFRTDPQNADYHMEHGATRGNPSLLACCLWPPSSSSPFPSPCCATSLDASGRHDGVSIGLFCDDLLPSGERDWGGAGNYEVWNDRREQEEGAIQEREEEESGDAMKTLENRTMDSKIEMDILDSLDDTKLINERCALDLDPPTTCFSPSISFLPIFFPTLLSSTFAFRFLCSSPSAVPFLHFPSSSSAPSSLFQPALNSPRRLGGPRLGSRADTRR